MSNHFSADNLKFPGDDTRLDLTDVYAFRSAEDPGKTVLIIDSNPTVRPPIELPPTVITSRDFHPGAVYQANGGASDCSLPTTAMSSRESSPRCRCAYGVPMRSPRSPGTRTTRH